MFKKLYNWLLWATNNLERPKNEIEFDIAFFIVNTIALIVGMIWLWHGNERACITFLIIEYTWAADNMRHNR